MRRSIHVLAATLLIGCSAGQEESSGGAGGGGGAVTVSASASTGLATSSVSTVASSSQTGGCSQDCANVPVPACYESVCNEQTHSCEVKQAANDSPCEDGLFCTDHDTCHAGICVAGDPLVCPNSGDDPCLSVECDEDADSCSSTPAANGSPCTSTDLCSSNAICQNGHCLGAPKDCSSVVLPDDCHIPGCEPATGDCLAVDQSDGFACVSGDPCESGKTCTAGACMGTPIAGCMICAEVEPNNTTATANVDATCSAWGGAIATVGDKDFYTVHVAVAGSRIDAEVNGLAGAGTCPSSFSSVLKLFNPAGTQIATDSISGVDSCSHISAGTIGSTNLAVGDYTVSVESGSLTTSPPYLVTLGVFAPGCGDGIVQAGEECDDGNTVDTDGCDNTCHFPGCTGGAVKATVAFTGPPVPIPDASTVGITNTLTITQVGTIQSVWAKLDITHTYENDLLIKLTPPAASAVTLIDNVGSSGDNFVGTILSSLATTPILSGTTPFTGIFQPTGTFAPILGTPANGIWTLGVVDEVGSDTGTLNDWTLTVCVQ